MFTPRNQAGSVSAFVAVVAIGLVMVAGMAYDGGEVVAAQATARDIAAGAARAGAQEIDVDHLRSSGEALLDPDRALGAARAFLDQTGHTGIVSVEGAAVTVTAQVRQAMRILPVADRVISATDTATAVDHEEVPER